MTFFNEVEVRSSWKDMTGNATIKIPKNVKVKGADLSVKPIKDVIKVGQPVVIQLGYNKRLKTYFKGYVKHVKPGIPIEIECEDDMWVMKRRPVTRKIYNGSLKQMLGELLPNVECDVFDTKLQKGYACINDAQGTVADVLQKVKQTFGLTPFFRLVPDSTAADGAKVVLNVGKPYSGSDVLKEKPVVYRLHENTKGDSLKYVYAEDNPIQIKGIVTVADGKDLVEEYPKNLFEASVKTRHFFNIDRETLKTLVKAEWARANIDRYDGSIQAFGEPFIRHGVVCRIVDDVYEKRDAMYFVDAVNTKVTLSGGFENDVVMGSVFNDDTITITR